MAFLKRFRKSPPETPVETPAAAPIPLSSAKGFVPPPPRGGRDPELEQLLEQSDALRREIEATESRSDPDGPYRQQLAVLEQALQSVEAEIAASQSVHQMPVIELEPVPVTHISVSLAPVPVVRFAIGDVQFQYEEEIDWAERGTNVVRSDLQMVAGNPSALVPDSLDPNRREGLIADLTASLFAFATELRDRAINETDQITGVTLADLSRPCPECGGWMLWNGVCLNCARREQHLHELQAERVRLLAEQSAAFEIRAQRLEQLPLQRRRLAETEEAILAKESS